MDVCEQNKSEDNSGRGTKGTTSCECEIHLRKNSKPGTSTTTTTTISGGYKVSTSSLQYVVGNKNKNKLPYFKVNKKDCWLLIQ